MNILKNPDEPENLNTELFLYFKMLLLKCFVAVRKHQDYICELISLMEKESPLSCFKYFKPDLLKERFHFNSSDAEVRDLL